MLRSRDILVFKYFMFIVRYISNETNACLMILVVCLFACVLQMNFECLFSAVLHGVLLTRQRCLLERSEHNGIPRQFTGGEKHTN